MTVHPIIVWMLAILITLLLLALIGYWSGAWYELD